MTTGDKPQRRLKDRALELWSWSQVALGLVKPFGGVQPQLPPDLNDPQRIAAVLQTKAPAEELVGQAADQLERNQRERRERAMEAAAYDRLPLAAELAPKAPAERLRSRSQPIRPSRRRTGRDR